MNHPICQKAIREIEKFILVKEFPVRTRELILRIFNSPPHRLVKSKVGNVCGRDPSSKMGVTIQTESRSLELPRVILLEDDPNVIGFIDQPEPVLMKRPDKKGHNRSFWAIPDFFVVSREFTGWEEVKSEGKLAALSLEQPNHFIQENGIWKCPPGETYAREFNLGFRIITEANMPHNLVRNLDYLANYRDVEPNISQEQLEQVKAHLKKNQGANLFDIQDALPSINADMLNSAVAHELIFVDLYAAPLRHRDQVKVFSSKAIAIALGTNERKLERMPSPISTLAVGAELMWAGAGYRIISVTPTSVKLVAVNGKALNVALSTIESELASNEMRFLDSENEEDLGLAKITQSSESELEEALRRHSILESGDGAGVCERTLRYWRAKQAQATENYGVTGNLAGLIPETSEKGNRMEKLPVSTKNFVNEFIRTEFESPRNASISAAYTDYLSQCAENDIHAVSSKTFRKYINLRPKEHQIRKREGPRAAYKFEQFLYLEFSLPRHGDHPWHVGHIDHTQVDVENFEGEPAGRPWLSILTLAFSRRVVAVILSYSSPSAITVLLLLRMCVIRHRRLPDVLVVDNGPEFRSGEFKIACGAFKIRTLWRPPRKARHGSVIERIFGTANTKLFHGLLGNTQVLRKVRQVTKSVYPTAHAVWDLPTLYLAVCEFFFEVYDTAVHTGIQETPLALHTQGQLTAGDRSMRIVTPSEDFKILTLPRTSRKTQIIRRQGIVVSGRNYWSESLRGLERSKVIVRYDPWDITTIYARVGGSWIRCLSDDRGTCDGLSFEELRFISEVWKEHFKETRRIASVPTKRMLEFVRKVRRVEFELLQRKMSANKIVLELAESGTLRLEEQKANVMQVVDEVTPSSSLAMEEIIARALQQDTAVKRIDLP